MSYNPYKKFSPMERKEHYTKCTIGEKTIFDSHEKAVYEQFKKTLTLEQKIKLRDEYVYVGMIEMVYILNMDIQSSQ